MSINGIGLANNSSLIFGVPSHDRESAPGSRFKIGDPNKGLWLGVYADGTFGPSGKAIDLQDPNTLSQGPVDQYNAYESLLEPFSKAVYNSAGRLSNVGWKLNTYESTDPTKTLEQAYDDAKAALSDYAKKSGISDVVSFEVLEDFARITINANGANSTSVEAKTFMFSWEDIGIEPPIRTVDEGYAFLSVDHHIFGKSDQIKLTNSSGEQIDMAMLEEMRKSINDDLAKKTAAWYEVNGMPPSTYDSAYTTSKYQPQNLLNPSFSSADSSAQGTDAVAQTFISEYKEIAEQKNILLEELQIYYSKDKILKRIEKFGVSDEAEIVKILDAQLDYGKDAINAIKTRGMANTEIGIEESLTNHLYSQLNGIAHIFGADPNELSKSVARGALGEDVQIDLGGFKVNYNEFLDIEKTMLSAVDGLHSALEYNRIINKGYIQNSIDSSMKKISELIDKYGPESSKSLTEWSETLKNAYVNGINEALTVWADIYKPTTDSYIRTYYNPDEFHSLLK